MKIEFGISIKNLSEKYGIVGRNIYRYLQIATLPDFDPGVKLGFHVYFEIDKIFKELLENPTSEIPTKYEFLREKIQLLEKILKLHLQCKTQEEIAGLVGLKQDNISIKLDKIKENFKELWKNPISEISIKFEFLRDKIQLLAEIPTSELLPKFEFLRDKIQLLADFQPQL